MLVFSASITGTSLPPAQESLIQRVVLRPLGVPQHVEYVPGDLLDGSSGVHRPGLRRTGREVVENPAARPPYSGQDQRQHYLVRDRLAPVVAISHPAPELRASLYVGPDELPTREPGVVVGKGLCESLGLGGLADPRRTDERYPHRFLVSSRMSNAGWLKSKGPRPGASALLARYR